MVDNLDIGDNVDIGDMVDIVHTGDVSNILFRLTATAHLGQQVVVTPPGFPDRTQVGWTRG